MPAACNCCAKVSSNTWRMVSLRETPTTTTLVAGGPGHAGSRHWLVMLTLEHAPSTKPAAMTNRRNAFMAMAPWRLAHPGGWAASELCGADRGEFAIALRFGLPPQGEGRSSEPNVR